MISACAAGTRWCLRWSAAGVDAPGMVVSSLLSSVRLANLKLTCEADRPGSRSLLYPSSEEPLNHRISAYVIPLRPDSGLSALAIRPERSSLR